ncbi:MAG: prepilin-type N-terminal cleavage/methylation domain-containing protein [Candidatus Omnitrophota bacterium]
MRLKKKNGFTLMEVMISAVISVLTITGCWAIYVVSNDFYHNSMHAFEVQSLARTTSEAILYGVGGDGLLQANGFAVTGGGSIVNYNGRILTYDNVTKQIMYTEGAANLELTPAYVQAAGGMAVTAFNAVQSVDAAAPFGRRVTITFEVSSLRENTDANNFTQDDVRSSMVLTVSARGRMI